LSELPLPTHMHSYNQQFLQFSVHVAFVFL